MCLRSIYDARNNLSSLVKTAESGEVVEITRHEKPVAVLIGYEEYNFLKNNQKSFLQSLDEAREKYGIDNLPSSYIDQVVKNIESSRNREIPNLNNYITMQN